MEDEETTEVTVAVTELDVDTEDTLLTELTEESAELTVDVMSVDVRLDTTLEAVE